MARVVLALEIFGIFVLGYRSFVHWRRTGSSGYVPLTRDSDPADAGARVLLALAAGLAATAPILAMTRAVRPLASLESSLLQVLGVAVFVAGFSVTVVGQFAMGDAWRVGVDPNEKTSLVTSGPFRLVRHPIFSGGIVTALGLFLMLPSPLFLAALVIGGVGIEVQARFVEERYLLRTHGDEYRSYAARTGRFVPLVGRLHRV